MNPAAAKKCGINYPQELSHLFEDQDRLLKDEIGQENRHPIFDREFMN
jgi:hypothetical protein